jgi:predicted transcriptional regulator
MMRMQLTKLHRFMDVNHVTDTDLAKESGISVRHVNYIKLGHKEPTRPRMAAILAACQKLTGKRAIEITDLFDFTMRKAA